MGRPIIITTHANDNYDENDDGGNQQLSPERRMGFDIFRLFLIIGIIGNIWSDRRDPTQSSVRSCWRYPWRLGLCSHSPIIQERTRSFLVRIVWCYHRRAGCDWGWDGIRFGIIGAADIGQILFHRMGRSAYDFWIFLAVKKRFYLLIFCGCVFFIAKHDFIPHHFSVCAEGAEKTRGWLYFY